MRIIQLAGAPGNVVKSATKPIESFFKGEYVAIDFAAKNDDAALTPLSTPADVLFGITIATNETTAFPVAEWNSGHPQITLRDEASAVFEIRLSREDLVNLNEGTAYTYNVWTVSGGTATVQGKGTVKLQSSIELTLAAGALPDIEDFAFAVDDDGAFFVDENNAYIMIEEAA